MDKIPVDFHMMNFHKNFIKHQKISRYYFITEKVQQKSAMFAF